MRQIPVGIIVIPTLHTITTVAALDQPQVVVFDLLLVIPVLPLRRDFPKAVVFRLLGALRISDHRPIGVDIASVGRVLLELCLTPLVVIHIIRVISRYAPAFPIGIDLPDRPVLVADVLELRAHDGEVLAHERLSRVIGDLDVVNRISRPLGSTKLLQGRHMRTHCRSPLGRSILARPVVHRLARQFGGRGRPRDQQNLQDCRCALQLNSHSVRGPLLQCHARQEFILLRTCGIAV